MWLMMIFRLPVTRLAETNRHICSLEVRNLRCRNKFGFKIFGHNRACLRFSYQRNFPLQIFFPKLPANILSEVLELLKQARGSSSRQCSCKQNALRRRVLAKNRIPVLQCTRPSTDIAPCDFFLLTQL